MSLVIKRYPDLGPSVLFYGGTESLRFTKQNWLWLRETPQGLVPLDGVTGVLKSTHNAAEPLINWALKVGFERFKNLMSKHMGPNDAYEIWENELDKIITEAKLASKDKLVDAGDVGTLAHNHLEKIAKATLATDTRRLAELIALMPEDPRAESCVIAAILWCVEHDIEWIYSERPVYHIDHGYCGTLDNVAWASSCQNPLCCPTPFTRRRVQIDYKSSNALRVSYVLQTAAYTAALEREMPEEIIEDRFILRLDKETAAFDPWHLEGRECQEQDFKAYLDALACYRSGRAVEARMNGFREVRQTAVREAKKAAKDAAHRLECPKAADYKGARMTKCFEDGTQCEACHAKFLEKHSEKS